MNSTTAALSTVWMRISKKENTLEIVIVKTTIGIVKKTLNLNITHNGTPLQKNQGCDWEYEIPDDKIVSVMPNDVSSVRVLYIDDYRIKEVICDKISFI